MAEYARPTRLSKPEPAMNMRALWRLATWGTTAAAALTLVVMASYSETGSRRITTAMASPAGKDEQKAQVQLAARSAEAEVETRRLSETVRTLTADRDRLAARLGAVERNLEDITGSIKRQAAANPPPTPATTTAPAGATTPAREAALSPATAPATSPPAAVEPAAAPSTPETSAGVAPTVEVAEPAKPDMGVDIGGATSSDGLRVLWNSTRTNHASLVEGLHPVVATRDNSRTKSKELRLILGPLDSIETATQLCAALTAARRYCHPVAFEGQKLAEAPERKPAARQAAPAPASRLPFFR